jgi:hypothetical protein
MAQQTTWGHGTAFSKVTELYHMLFNSKVRLTVFMAPEVLLLSMPSHFLQNSWSQIYCLLIDVFVTGAFSSSDFTGALY